MEAFSRERKGSNIRASPSPSKRSNSTVRFRSRKRSELTLFENRSVTRVGPGRSKSNCRASLRIARRVTVRSSRGSSGAPAPWSPSSSPAPGASASSSSPSAPPSPGRVCSASSRSTGIFASKVWLRLTERVCCVSPRPPGKPEISPSDGSSSSTAGEYRHWKRGLILCRTLEKGPNAGKKPKRSVFMLAPTLNRVGVSTNRPPVSGTVSPRIVSGGLTDRNHPPETSTLGRSEVLPMRSIW